MVGEDSWRCKGSRIFEAFPNCQVRVAPKASEEGLVVVRSEAMRKVVLPNPRDHVPCGNHCAGRPLAHPQKPVYGCPAKVVKGEHCYGSAHAAGVYEVLVGINARGVESVVIEKVPPFNHVTTPAQALEKPRCHSRPFDGMLPGVVPLPYDCAPLPNFSIRIIRRHSHEPQNRYVRLRCLACWLSCEDDEEYGYEIEAGQAKHAGNVVG